MIKYKIITFNNYFLIIETKVNYAHAIFIAYLNKIIYKIIK